MVFADRLPDKWTNFKRRIVLCAFCERRHSINSTHLLIEPSWSEFISAGQNQRRTDARTSQIGNALPRSSC